MEQSAPTPRAASRSSAAGTGDQTETRFAASDPPEFELRHVEQGSYLVSRSPQVCLTTLLGSCVATCLFDQSASVGGMNHYLLPDGDDNAGGCMRFGANAMELLINGLLKQGAHKSDMQAKVFGGSQLLGGRSDIGQRNAEFAKRFLADEGIPVVGGSLGGQRGRRLRFFPTTGRVQQRFLSETPPAIARPATSLSPAPTGELELF